jgi:hypothetical protein
VDAAFAEADGGVEGSEAAETDGDGRHGSARPEGAIFVLEDGDEIGGHGIQITGCGWQIAGIREEGGARREGRARRCAERCAFAAALH